MTISGKIEPQEQKEFDKNALVSKAFDSLMLWKESDTEIKKHELKTKKELEAIAAETQKHTAELNMSFLKYVLICVSTLALVAIWVKDDACAFSGFLAFIGGGGIGFGLSKVEAKKNT